MKKKKKLFTTEDSKSYSIRNLGNGIQKKGKKQALIEGYCIDLLHKIRL